MSDNKQGDLFLPPTCPQFDGNTYEPALDYDRLGAQMRAVTIFMLRGGWYTLAEISAGTGGYPEASISARLRDLRKGKFGDHIVGRRRRGDPTRGLFEYQLIPRPRT